MLLLLTVGDQNDLGRTSSGIMFTKFRENRSSRLNAVMENTQQLGDKRNGKWALKRAFHTGLSDTLKNYKPNRNENKIGNYFLLHTEISVISIYRFSSARPTTAVCPYDNIKPSFPLEDSSRMACYAASCALPGVSEYRNAFIFTVKQSRRLQTVRTPNLVQVQYRIKMQHKQQHPSNALSRELLQHFASCRLIHILAHRSSVQHRQPQA